MRKRWWAVGGASALLACGVLTAIATLAADRGDGVPPDGENERVAEILADDLSAVDSVARLEKHFPATDRSALAALAASCGPIAVRAPAPAIHADIIPTSARILLTDPEGAVCDARIEWVDGESAWHAYLSQPGPG